MHMYGNDRKAFFDWLYINELKLTFYRHSFEKKVELWLGGHLWFGLSWGQRRRRRGCRIGCDVQEKTSIQ